MIGFDSELELSRKVLANPFFSRLVFEKGCQQIVIKELRGLAGRPDLFCGNFVVEKEHLKIISAFSFELKLRNWKRALIQAYKYKSFSNYAYVIIDEAYSRSAVRNIKEFETSNIGLLTIDTFGEVKSIYQPHLELPFSPVLEKKLIYKLNSNVSCKANDKNFANMLQLIGDAL